MTESMQQQAGSTAESAASISWYAVYVRSRHEFSVQQQLTSFNIDNYLPAVERLRRWKDRKKLVTFPLFPGYIFVHVENRKDAFLSVLKLPGVVKFLSLRPGPPDTVPDAQIEALKNLVACGRDIEPYHYLKQGQRVRIKWGPLAGVEGILVQKRGQQMLVLAIDILQQGASVKIDAADVEPV